MNWKEVSEQLRHGAKLVCTDEFPGGWCFALRHQTPSEPDSAKLTKVQAIPRWVGAPSSSDMRPVLAALELAIATEVS